MCFEIRYSYFEIMELIWNDYRILLACTPPRNSVKDKEGKGLHSYLPPFDFLITRNTMDGSIFQAKGHQLPSPHAPPIDAKMFLRDDGTQGGPMSKDNSVGFGNPWWEVKPG